jgi:ribosomal protein S18 acetylase RimI-like enzyme
MQTVALANEIGSNLIRLRTAKNNIVAQGLYHKMGFVRDEVLYSYDLAVK